MNCLLLLFLFFLACGKDTTGNLPLPETAWQITKTVFYNDVSVDVVIDKPEGREFDVLVLFHGTVGYDSLILDAAYNVLNVFKGILDRNDMMLVSVAYPEENLLFGDNIKQSEAALLWLKSQADQDLGVTIKKIFLAGHSQGGYLVTRLNTMYQTDGVIANAPGPLNLVFRCELEEKGKIPNGMACSLLFDEYGSTAFNPDAYYQRSLLNFTSNFKSNILFVQGLNDSPIQMHSWPVFKQQIEEGADCQKSQFLELPGYGHSGLFHSPKAKSEFNDFINSGCEIPVGF